MEWRYKTVHYAVKKDGLLGSSFLDEEEMERSLNDYGERGWELVSLLEVRDGVVAVFKQEKDLFQGGCLAEIVPDQDGVKVVQNNRNQSAESEICQEGGTQQELEGIGELESENEYSVNSGLERESAGKDDLIGVSSESDMAETDECLTKIRIE